MRRREKRVASVRERDGEEVTLREGQAESGYHREDSMFVGEFISEQRSFT